MIIFLLILSALVTFMAMTLISKTSVRVFITAIGVVGVVASAGLMVANDREHFGMHQVTETTTQDIYSPSAKSGMNMLLYKSIGTADKERVYIYNKKTNQKKPSTTAVDKTTNTVKETKKAKAYLVQKTTRWVYNSNATKLWFGIADNNREVKHRSNTFYLPKTWVKLSTTQASQLQKQMKKQDPKMKAQAAQTIKSKVTQLVQQEVAKARKQNPSMSATQQQALVKSATKKATAEVTAQYQAQMVKKLIANTK